MKNCCGLSVPPDKIKNATVAYRPYNGAIRRFLLLIVKGGSRNLIVMRLDSSQ